MTAVGGSLDADQLVDGSPDALVQRTLGGVRILVLNNPARRNAMSVAMRRRFAEAIEAASTDEAILSIVVTGAGGAFSSGLDTSEPTNPADHIAVRPHPGEAARRSPKPVIAAVDGVCVTGALELALSCTFIVASDRSRFADTHAKLGMFPSWGMTALLPRAIGIRRARQMSLTGQFIDAQTAYHWGLVNELRTPANLLPYALELANGITACDPASVRPQLTLLDETEGTPVSSAIVAEEEASLVWHQARRKRLDAPPTSAEEDGAKNPTKG